MVTFHDNVRDPTFPRALVFRLGGEYRECSLVEFSRRMGLYEAHETITHEFILFLRDATQVYADGVSGPEFWSNIATGVFNSGVSPESSIKSPIHRLIHHLITFSIHHKRHGDKVTKSNLFFLWCILQPGVCCNIPYFLARYLADYATSARPGSPICGGPVSYTHLTLPTRELV